jgi:hypothetical protein
MKCEIDIKLHYDKKKNRIIISPIIDISSVLESISDEEVLNHTKDIVIREARFVFSKKIKKVFNDYTNKANMSEMVISNMKNVENVIIKSARKIRKSLSPNVYRGESEVLKNFSSCVVYHNNTNTNTNETLNFAELHCLQYDSNKRTDFFFPVCLIRLGKTENKKLIYNNMKVFTEEKNVQDNSAKFNISVHTSVKGLGKDNANCEGFEKKEITNTMIWEFMKCAHKKVYNVEITKFINKGRDLSDIKCIFQFFEKNKKTKKDVFEYIKWLYFEKSNSLKFPISLSFAKMETVTSEYLISKNMKKGSKYHDIRSRAKS